MERRRTDDFGDKARIGFWILMLVITYVVLAVFCYFAYFKNATVIYLHLGEVQINSGHIAGFFALVFMLVALIGVYVYFVSREVLCSRRKILVYVTSLLISFFIIVIVVKAFGRPDLFGEQAIFLAPLALSSLLVALLVDRKIAYFSNFIIVIIFFMVENLFGELSDAVAYYPMICGLLTSVVASYFAKTATRRTDYVLIGVITGFVSVFVALCIYVLFNNGYSQRDMLICALYSLSSGIISIVLFFLFIPLLEWVFNLITDMRLAELSSTNQPLLKKLMAEAPGTYHHSVTVASYAEACASAINADPFLARCAGLYHDIGKLKEPIYFVENQTGTNPHDELTPEVSVMTIRRHTIYGLQLANDYRLPYEVKKVIVEHHGSLPIAYFLAKAKKLTEGEVDEKEYSYEGRTPTSKISAIIMIADACEAALKTLDRAQNESAIKIIDSIVNERLRRGQFDACDITMKELDTIKKTIISTFAGIKHERIKYPDQK